MGEKNIDTFFRLFEQELQENEDLRSYHRIINSESLYLFRKSYVYQRLDYVIQNISGNDIKILDIGCGYGTTDLLLAFLGFEVTGTTLEFYYDKIEKRLEYWKNYVDTSRITIKYENLFKSDYPEESFDYVILQDTLHHLEPIDNALQIIYHLMKKDSKLIAIEENGNNIIQNLKLIKQRGFKRIIEVHDDKLNEKYLMGNENIRSFSKWNKLFRKNGLTILNNKTQYIRLFPSFYFKKYGIDEIVKREQKIWKKSNILKEFFYFGINFIAYK